MVSEKKILSFSVLSLWELMTPGHGQFGPQRLDWQDFYGGPLNICAYQVYKPCASWFLRRRFFKVFPHFKCMGVIYGHGGHLDLRTMTICTYFQSPFSTRLHVKFEEIWLRGFRGEVLRCERTDGRTPHPQMGG